VVLFMNENDLSAGNRAMTVLRSLPMAHKAAIGAAVVVVALAGFVFLQWISSPSYSVLASDVTAADLGEITAQLETSGISYRIENGGDRVMVPRQDFASAKSVLATAGITTDAAGARDRGYELLDQQGFGVSSNLERINVQRALEGELARSARAMDGVEDAVVHLVMPEASLFGDPEGASASIVLDTVDGFGAAGARAVASLVAGAVVIDLQGRTLLAPDDGTAIVEASSAASQTREFEKRLEEDITRLLLSAGAGDRSTVMVQATLDFDQVSRRIESYDPESQVPLREQTETEQFVGDSSLAPGGVPGVDGGEVELPDPTTEGSSYVRNDRVTEFGVDNIVTNEIQAAGALIELHVGVVVDDGSLTGAAVPDADTISNLISNAVGIDPARGDSIVVASVPFPAIEDAEPIALPTGAAAAAGSSPLDLIPQVVGALVLILVVAVVLLMLRSANKQAPLLITPELSSGSAGSLVESTSEGEQAALAPAAAEDPRSEVRRLVERQPEEIAGLLRSWLTEA
jgi:flagellar M-ring protein FliF